MYCMFVVFSELRLVEAMDGICEKILEYNMHKERTGSLRFAKVFSITVAYHCIIVDNNLCCCSYAYRKIYVH